MNMNSTQKDKKIIDKDRLDHVLSYESDFVYDKKFKTRNHRRLLDLPLLEGQRSRIKPPPDAELYYRSLYHVPLLSPKGEQNAFLRMNYAKYMINVKRSKLTKSPDLESIQYIERLIKIATDTRNEIVRRNLRLVVHIVSKFHNSPFTRDELVSEGNIGLLRATEKFDVSLGYRFSTYATHCIRRQLYQQFTTYMRRCQKYPNMDVEEQSQTCDPCIIDEMSISEETGLVRKAVRRLPERERKMVEMRYGFNGYTPMTLKQVGNKFGVSKGRVRQLVWRAVSRLREVVSHEERRSDARPDQSRMRED